jgi:hypothetical protein
LTDCICASITASCKLSLTVFSPAKEADSNETDKMNVENGFIRFKVQNSRFKVPGLKL